MTGSEITAKYAQLEQQLDRATQTATSRYHSGDYRGNTAIVFLPLAMVMFKAMFWSVTQISVVLRERM